MPRASARRLPSICARSSRLRSRPEARRPPHGSWLLFENFAGSERRTAGEPASKATKSKGSGQRSLTGLPQIDEEAATRLALADDLITQLRSVTMGLGQYRRRFESSRRSARNDSLGGASEPKDENNPDRHENTADDAPDI